MKKFVGLLIVMTMCITMCSCRVAAELPKDFVIPVMQENDATAQGLVKLGILKGTGNGLELGRNVTRAEAVALILRIHHFNGAFTQEYPMVFDDIQEHWAENEIIYAYKLGIVEGAGNKKFEPDRKVTGKEFAKMIMSTVGYDDITIANVYKKSMDAELLLNNYSKKVVEENWILTRSDAVRLLWGAFLTRLPNGGFYKDKLLETGKFTEEDFNGTLYTRCGIQ